MSVEAEAIEFCLLTSAARDHGSALVVYLEHQLRCFRVRIVEELLENPRHVGHEVDGIVPDDDEPGAIGFCLLVGTSGRERAPARSSAARSPSSHVYSRRPDGVSSELVAQGGEHLVGERVVLTRCKASE